MMLDGAPHPPGAAEFLQGFGRAVVRTADRWRRLGRSASGFGLVLDRRVPIIYACSTGRLPLGIAPAARRCPRAVVLLFFTVSKERRRAARRIRQAAVYHRLANPGHTLVFLCNTAKEEALMREQGELALHLNHNIFVSDRVFRPLAERPIVHDAVYNARLAPFKRHELSLEVERCAFIYYQTGDETNASDAAVRERHGRLAPTQIFLNPLAGGKPGLLSPAEVNEVYNRSAVGLCLSAYEGAMFASMEYMLSGLPIVSTPSLGGRDVYFDDDYCLIVRPDPREIRDAVLALKARRIPRDFVAARTLEKVERDRRRLSALLDELRARAGLQPDASEQPFEPMVRLQWRPWDHFLAQLAPEAFA